MPYPTKNLNPGEAVALDTHPHWWFFSRHILTAFPLVLAGYLSWRVDGWVGDGIGLAFKLAAVAWLVWLGLKFLSWRFTYFMVSDQRVVYRTGVLARRGVEIPLTRVANINFAQSVWTRVIGAGDLDIESAGREGTTQFSDVRHPDAVQQIIYRQMDIAEGRASERMGRAAGAAAGDTAGTPHSVADELRKLAALVDDGLLTEAEFTVEKRRLLGGPGGQNASSAS